LIEDLSAGPLAGMSDDVIDAFSGLLQRPLRDPYLKLAEFARVMTNADLAWYRTIDKGNGFTLSAVARRESVPDFTTGTTIPFGRNLGTEAIRQGRPQYTEDLLLDARIDQPEESKSSIKRQGIRSVAVIPVITNSVPRGILCIGFCHPVPLTDGLHDACERLAEIAARTVEVEEDSRQTEQTISELRRVVEDVSQRQNAFAQVFTLERQLVNRAASGHDVDSLLSQLSSETGGAVVLADRFGSPIASAGCSAEDAAAIALNARAQKHVRVTLDGELIGHLVAGNGRLDESGRARLAAFTSALAVALARRKTIATTKIGLTQNIVDALIDGLVPASVTTDAHLLGFDLTRPARMFVLRIVRDGAELLDSDRSRIEALIAEFGASRELTICASWRGPDLVLLVPSSALAKGGDAPLAHQILKTIARDKIARHVTVRAGVGGIAKNLHDFPRSYREAVMCLDAKQPDDSPIVFFDELGVQWLISQLPPEALQVFHDRVLGDLQAYDDLHGGHLIESLRAFLDARCDAVAAGHALNVHPNTMRYRLQRIRELTGLDMSEADVRLSVEVALRVDASPH
jgi:hypothetical protein